MKKLLILAVLTAVTSTSLLAQNPGEDELGNWVMVFTQNRVSEKLSVHAEAQARYYELTDNFNQLLLRTALNYHISENAMASFGYGYIATDISFEELDGEKNVTENRIYQQFVLRNAVGKLKFSHRYRLEQRFIDRPFGENSTEHRARYFLRVTYPLNDKWFLTAYDEVFINLQNDFFGQNRLYGAVGYNLNPDINIQVGYLKNDFSVDTFDRLQFAVFFKTDLRKKKKEKS